MTVVLTLQSGKNSLSYDFTHYRKHIFRQKSDKTSFCQFDTDFAKKCLCKKTEIRHKFHSVSTLGTNFSKDVFLKKNRTKLDFVADFAQKIAKMKIILYNFSNIKI